MARGIYVGVDIGSLSSEPLLLPQPQQHHSVLVLLQEGSMRGHLPNDHRHAPSAKGIGNLISPGSAVGISTERYQIYVPFEVNRSDTLICNGDFDVHRRVSCDHAEIEGRGVRLRTPRKEALL